MHISERQGSAIGLEETNTELTLPPSTVAERGYNTVNGRHTCGVVFSILKEGNSAFVAVICLYKVKLEIVRNIREN